MVCGNEKGCIGKDKENKKVHYNPSAMGAPSGNEKVKLRAFDGGKPQKVRRDSSYTSSSSSSRSSQSSESDCKGKRKNRWNKSKDKRKDQKKTNDFENKIKPGIISDSDSVRDSRFEDLNGSWNKVNAAKHTANRERL